MLLITFDLMYNCISKLPNIWYNIKIANKMEEKMAVLVTKEKNKAVFTVEINQDEFKKACQNAYLKNKKAFSLPGFRKGKVPRKILEAHYGAEIFYEDAINGLLPQKYSEAVEELGLEPVATPSVDVENIEKEKPVKVKFEVDVKPEFQLGDYQNLKSEISDFTVTKDDINQKIQSELEANARLVNIDDRAVQDGDIININFRGFINEEEFEGGQADDYELTVGSNTFIPGFEDQIIGHNVEDEFDINVTFPEEYHEKSFAGKPAVFKVKLNTIQERILPELDDEFVKDVSEFDTLDEYKKNVEEELKKTAVEQEKAEKQNKAVEALIEATSIDVPQSMIEEEVNREFQDVESRVSSMGINMEQYFMFTNTTEQVLRDQLRQTANTRVRGDLVLEKFIETENIEVTDEELDNELNVMADRYSQQDKEKFIQNMKESNNLEFIKDDIKKKKAVAQLSEMTEFSIKKVEE